MLKLIDLKGQTFNLSFEEDVTVQAIRQKLLKEYNFDSNRCYFCRSGKILKNEKITKEALASGASDIPIIIFDSQTFPDKSYPKVDNAFQWSLSRYNDRFLMSKSKIPIGAEIPEEDFTMQIERLLNQGVIPPSGLFSRILRIARHRNNQNSVNIHSNSDDDDEAEPTPDINSNQQINNIPYEDDDFPPPGDEMLEPFLINDIQNDYQPAFVLSQDDQEYMPRDVFTHAFDPPERNFMFNDFIYDPILAPPEMQQQQEEEQQSDHQEDQNPQQPNDQAGEQQNNQHLLEDQNQLEQDDQLPPLPPNRRQYQVPFPFDFGRRQDDLNQQIIEGLNLNITLSEADNRAISRLAQAGYDRATVIQVYEACDRNEEAAMNLLVSMG